MRREGLQTQPFAFIPNSDGRHQENRPLTSSCLGDFVVQFSDATRGRPEPLVSESLSTRYVAFCFLLIILTVLPVSSWAETAEKRGPTEACAAYRKLSQDPAASAEQWREVVKSLISAPGDQTKNPCSEALLFAGKASVALYRLTRRVEDLDNAIKWLYDFKTSHPDHPQWIAALKQLKTAHLLKLRHLGTAHARTVLRHRSKDWQENKSSESPTDSSPSVQWRQAANGADGGQNSRPCSARRPSAGSFEVVSIQGNPFYVNKSGAPAIGIPSVKYASIPRTTVADREGTRPVAALRKRTFVVVIDPGHGGKDPGAVSSDGQVKEKDVTLAVSLRIKERLERRNPSVKVELTRSDDSFLTVSERTVLANSFNADLFISIHCNSYSDSRAKGVETYYLSKASSHAAMVVAARENSIPLEKMTDVEATLLDLMMTSKKTESHKLANAVHQALVRVLAGPTRSRRDRGVKRAPFYVLLGATMPAILVECAYISNVKEKDRLTSSRYLNLVAEGICDGAQIYLRGLGEGG
jgi:N-acetylmuramoyl-L-alanine amidase